MSDLKFVHELEALIRQRVASGSAESYTARLAGKGIGAVAQKVGEEGVELALAGVGQSDEQLVDEAADLLFHMLILLALRGHSLADVVGVLAARHQTRIVR